jgi:hypothetical protein
VTGTTTRIKTGGRKAGVPNKLTFQTRQILLGVVASELENLPELLEKLDPIQRVDSLCKLLKYILPTMEAVTSRVADRIGLKDTSEFIEELEAENKRTNFRSV